MNDLIEIVLITDSGYLTPTYACISSIISNRSRDHAYRVNVVAVDVSDEDVDKLRTFGNDSVEVRIFRESKRNVSGLHSENSAISANETALFKFYIPEILRDLNRVLYLDGDLIVRTNLVELFNYEMGDALVGAVVDSFPLFERTRPAGYFNSGVLLMNLSVMRDRDLSKSLIDNKRHCLDNSLIDQNVFNSVIDVQDRVYLPFRYNVPYPELALMKPLFSVSDLNALHGTSYGTLLDVESDASIIHFAGKWKPWRSKSVPLSEEWYRYYRSSPAGAQPLTRTQPRPRFFWYSRLLPAPIISSLLKTKRHVSKALNRSEKSVS